MNEQFLLYVPIYSKNFSVISAEMGVVQAHVSEAKKLTLHGLWC